MSRAAASSVRALAVAREEFLTTGQLSRDVRPEVAQSWRRSAAFGVADIAMAPVELTDGALRSYRDSHPLALAMPVVRELLVTHANDDQLLVAVGDAEGRLLWVEGPTVLRRQAERMHFVEGAQWDEAHAGTNAPGVALATSQASRVVSAEHFQQAVQRWSCSAVPVHNPDGDQIGVIDVTGDERAAQSTMLALVRATAAAVEAELRLRMPLLPPGALNAPPSAALHLQVLGRDEPWLTIGGRQLALTPRHGELLLLLAASPRGLSSDDLAFGLDERPLDPVTVRAELSRLRRTIGAGRLASRPYRLNGQVSSDVTQVRRLLDRGAHRAAVSAYAGPVMPHSIAPGVVALREQLHAEVRDALLRHPDPKLLLSWVETPAGREDVEAWRMLQATLPTGSGRGRRAGVHARVLDTHLTS